jgi:hypothetical protein
VHTDTKSDTKSGRTPSLPQKSLRMRPEKKDEKNKR